VSSLEDGDFDACGVISRTNQGQTIKGPTAGVDDRAFDLRLLGSGGGIETRDLWA
jgi:hypothetical protein